VWAVVAFMLLAWPGLLLWYLLKAMAALAVVAYQGVARPLA
jgi:hypothetical protein